MAQDPLDLGLRHKSAPIVWNGTGWVPVAANADGELIVEATIGDVTIDSADGAITDGVDSDIKATVFDYVGSNPLAVTLVDAAGDQYDATGGSGGAVELEEQLDYDSGAGSVPVSVVGIALPGAGGPVAGGTTANPVVVFDSDLFGIIPTQDSGAAFADTVPGFPALATRKDADAALNADGTYTLLQVDATGYLKTNVKASALPTGAATSAKQDTQITSLQLIDDVIYVDDADWTDDTSKHALVGGVYQASPHTVTDGDVTPFLTDVNGRLAIAGAVTVSGVATAANQTTIIGHVDGIETLLTAIDGHVDGIEGTQASSVTALQLIDDPVVVLGTATYTETTSKGMLIGVVRRDADTTLVDTTNEFTALQVDAAGKLKVEIFDGGDSHTVDNGGTFAVQVDGAALTALQLIDDIVYVDDTATHSTGTSKGALIMAAAVPTDTSVNANDIAAVAMTTDRKLHVAVMDALPAGSAAIGKLAANSGVIIGDVNVVSNIPGVAATSLGKAEDAGHTTGDTGVMSLGVRSAAPSERSAGPTDGDYEPFATNEVGAVWVTVTPSANGGAATLNSTSSDGGTALTSTAQAIKGTPGTLKGYYIYNPNTSAQFVQFYNTAQGSVTVGTTNPLFMLTVPAQAAANLWMADGIAFATALSWSATSTAGGNGAPSTALDAVAWYK